MLQSQLLNHGLYGVWIAPTLYKCKVGYRYMKAMCPDIHGISFRDSALEISLANHSFVKFLHGRDAETTVEGDAIDSFVIDEAGKQKSQLWHSLFTTITQTDGRGIVTGTPRGRTWYYDLFGKAVAGDPFLCQATLKTIDSPYIKPEAVERARRLLPPLLFQQYYLAQFVSDSTVYGDLSGVWRDDLVVDKPGFWIHPDAELLRRPVVIGVDLAKRNDYTVFFAVADNGETVGFLRMRRKTFGDQAKILGRFASRFRGEGNEIRYDRTGIGDAVGEEISKVFDRHTGDWSISPVVFTNASKQEMVSRMIQGIETHWFRSPRIPRLEHELINLEVAVTKSGLHTYSAAGGDHDDCHWAAALAVSGALHTQNAGFGIDMIEDALSGKLIELDDEQPDDDNLDANEFGEQFDDEVLEDWGAL
jgi:hypothetical protein